MEKSKQFYRAVFGNRQWYGTKQGQFKCAMTGTEVVAINLYFQDQNGNWKWAGHLGNNTTSMAFDADQVTPIAELPKEYNLYINTGK